MRRLIVEEQEGILRLRVENLKEDEGFYYPVVTLCKAVIMCANLRSEVSRSDKDEEFVKTEDILEEVLRDSLRQYAETNATLDTAIEGGDFILTLETK